MGEHLSKLKHFSYKEQVARSISWGHYFIFLNILLTCFESFAYVYAAPPFEGVISLVYMIVAWLGHMTFLTVVGYLVIFFPLAFIGNFRYYRVLAVILATILHTILLFDIKIFLMVKVHLSMTALNLIVRELDLNTGLNYNFLFIAIPLVLAFELVFAKITTHSLYKAHHTIFVRSVFCCLVGCFISSHLIHIWADAVKYGPITVLRSTFPAHYPMTARSFLSSHGWLSEEQLQSGDPLVVSYPLSHMHASPDGQPHNILVIAVNDLSYSNLSTELTPELLKLKQNAQSFEQNYLLYEDELSNLFSMTYGLPLQYRYTLNARGKIPVIVDEMFKQDFVPRILVSYPDQLKDEFTVYADKLLPQVGLRQVQLIQQNTGANTLSQAEQLITQYSRAEESRPFAMLVVLNDLKFAHLNKVDLQSHLTAAKDPYMQALLQYETALKHLDQQLGAMLNSLQEQKLLDNTVVVLTSLSGSPFVNARGDFNRKKQHVPLFIMWPDRYGIGSSEDKLSSLRDLVATMAQEVLHITTSTGNFTLGENLRHLSKRDFLIVDGLDAHLVLLGEQDTVIFSKDGSSYVERDGRQLQVRPNLEDLIRATRDINRFLK